jgi:hypothetical protein
MGTPQAQGSVIFHYEGGPDASPEIFKCIGMTQSHAP